MGSELPWSSESAPVFSYNAGKLSPREVAKTFVPPAAFDPLIRADNAILVGPRGSGKTTLLKMLQSEALDEWTAQEANECRQLVQISGVFVGANRMWSEQLKAGGVEADAFGMAAYALHVGRSLARTMSYRTSKRPVDSPNHLHVHLDFDDEVRACTRIATLFKLPIKPPTFTSLTSVFGQQLAELGGFRYSRQTAQHLPDWAHLDALECASQAVEAFNEAASQPEHRWSLLFDELELAPPAVLRDILTRFRGHQESLVLKASLSPVIDHVDLLSGELGATHGQDVEFIELTSPGRLESVRFAERLFQRHLNDAGLPSLSPFRVLGESRFGASEDSLAGGGSDPYAQRGSVWKAMKYLRDSDATFAEYLTSNDVDLMQLDQLDRVERAAKLRKIRNLAVVRAWFRGESGRRSRKSRELYAGANSMLALPDGNPRMATILIRDLVSRMRTRNTSSLSPSQQAAAIDSLTQRFMALLHAQTGVEIGGRPVSLVGLLDRVGAALSDMVVTSDFRPDVAAGFWVDHRLNDEYMPLLRQAINTGAIIHMPAGSRRPVRGSQYLDREALSSSPRGRHYRLSYLLAPQYGLPLRQGKTVPLSFLLSNQSALTEGQVPLDGI